MSNGRQIAEHNVAVFTAWVASKTDPDFRSITHRGALSRSVIAQECGFAKSALAQNPRIKSLLNELETRLRASGVLPSSNDTIDLEDQQSTPSAPHAKPSPHTTRTTAKATPDLESKLQRLQSENACQRAEIEELRKQLKQFTSIHEALSNSGRIPR